MPSFTDPLADAVEAREAARALAHATLRFNHPVHAYAVLGSLSAVVGSLAQSLHQLGDFHDTTASGMAHVDGSAREGRATAYQVSWDLHRAGEMLRQVAETIDRAHQAEGRITYDVTAVASFRVGNPTTDRTTQPVRLAARPGVEPSVQPVPGRRAAGGSAPGPGMSL